MIIIKKCLVPLAILAAGFYASFHVGEDIAVVLSVLFSAGAGLAAVWTGGRALYANRDVPQNWLMYLLVLAVVGLFLYLDAASLAQNFAFRK